LSGLSESDAQAAYWKMIDEYTEEGVELWGITQHWYICKPDRPAAIVKLLMKAIEVDDRPAIRKCVGVAVANHDAPNQPGLESFFVPAMTHLTAKADTRWLDETWYQTQSKTFFSNLSDDHIGIVFENLVTMPRLDTHADAVLSAIARSRAELVWQFFGSPTGAATSGSKRGRVRSDTVPICLPRKGKLVGSRRGDPPRASINGMISLHEFPVWVGSQSAAMGTPL
jgi:hypothetical protein